MLSLKVVSRSQSVCVFAAFAFGAISVHAEPLTCEELLGRPAEPTVSSIYLKNSAESMFRTIEAKYAPLTMKMETGSGAHEPEVGTAKKRWNDRKHALLAKTGKFKFEIDQLFANAELVAGFNDGHANVWLPSTYTWTLPMSASFHPPTGQYFLSFIEPAQAAKQVIKGQLPPLGAELVKIDGKPVDEYRKARPILSKMGTKGANQSNFASQIFSLQEAVGVPLSRMDNDGTEFTFRWQDESGRVVQKTVTMKYIESGSNIAKMTAGRFAPIPGAQPSVFQHLLVPMKMPENFLATPETLMYRPRKIAPATQFLVAKNQPQPPLSKAADALPESAQLSDRRTAPATPGQGFLYEIGQRRPLFQLPADFVSIKYPQWLAKLFPKNGDGYELPAFAGTFVHEGKRVGLLRIPSFPDVNPATTKVLIDHIITLLEANSDYLILDETHNAGGSFTNADIWLHRLRGKFDEVNQIALRVKPSDNYVLELSRFYDMLNANPGNIPASLRTHLLEEMRAQMQIVQDTRAQGLELTPPINILPVAKLFEAYGRAGKAPTSVHADIPGVTRIESIASPVYTKKVYALIDHLTVSAGEAMAGMLKDSGRATLIGSTTAGMGGSVEVFPMVELNIPYKLILTTGLQYRQGNPQNPYIENKGVDPHIVFYPSVTDYADGMKSYLPRLLKLISEEQAAGR